MRVQGPLHSALASGTLGRTLCYRATARGVLVEIRPPYPDRRSPAQRSQRAALDVMARIWKQLPLPDRLAWASIVPRTAPTPYHAFLRHNLQRWRGYLPPLRRPTPDPLGEPASGGGLSLDVAPRRVTGKVYVNLPRDGLALFFHRSTEPLFHCGGHNLVSALPLGPPGYHTFTDSPLAPGTYYYRHRYAQPDGAWSAEGTVRAAVVPAS